jgi:DNA polymerase I-like protein with 3'-5' exonuclease and polymerase domains
MRLVLDIETTTDHKKIHVVVTKDIDTGEVKTWRAATGLSDYLSKATLLIGHNIISFDAPILNRIWKTQIRLSQVFDTLIASRLLDPSREQGHSLEAWGKTLGVEKINYRAIWLWLNDYAGEQISKDEKVPKGVEFDFPHHGLMEHYCKRDVDVCANLYLRLCKELAEKEFSQESIDLEHKVASIIAEQERNGFKLSVEQCTLLLVDWKNRISEILGRAQQLYPPVTTERYSEKTGKQLKDSTTVFNMGSRQQVAQKLMELGWKPKRYTDKGSVIIDESVLEEIIQYAKK